MEAMEDLQHYMKVCYLGMLTFANEVVFDVLKGHGLNTLPYIKEAVSRKTKININMFLVGGFPIGMHWLFMAVGKSLPSISGGSTMVCQTIHSDHG